MDQEQSKRIQAVGYDYGAQPKEFVESCDLCSATEGFVLVAERDRYGFPVRTHLCSRCGFGFLSPRLDSEGYARLYESYYRPLTWAYKGRTMPMKAFLSKQRAYAERIDRLLLEPIFSNGKVERVLDVGGSTGVVGHHFAERYGCEVTVLDPAPDELEVAREQGLQTLRGTIDALVPGEEKYDAILVCQTIHHVPRVDDAFTNLRAMLRPGGHLFLDMVDFRSLCRHRRSIADATHLDHANYMVDGVIREFFRKHGLRVIRTDAARLLYFGYLCRSDLDSADPGPFMDTRSYLEELKRIQVEPSGRAAAPGPWIRLKSAVARRLHRR